MGIKGTVRRSGDAHVIHANVDTDIIVAEEAPFGSQRKPDELHALIEHFALVSALAPSLLPAHTSHSYAAMDLAAGAGLHVTCSRGAVHVHASTQPTAADALLCIIR